MNVNVFSDPEDLLGTAYHEAGHAVIGALLNRPPISVTIIAIGACVGKTEFTDDFLPEYRRRMNDSAEKKEYIKTRILIAVAGSIAHEIFAPGRIPDAGDINDLKHAAEMMDESSCWVEDPKSYLEGLQLIARTLLFENWSWVQAVAIELMSRKTLGIGDVQRLMPSKE